MAETQTSITIRRNSPDDAQQRQIIVEAELLFGNSVTLPVKPGRHRLRVDNTWNWKTLDLDLKPGDHLKYLTINRAGRWTWFLVTALGAGPMYVSIQPEE